MNTSTDSGNWDALASSTAASTSALASLSNCLNDIVIKHTGNKKKRIAYLELLLSSETPLFDVLLEAADGVASAAHALDFLACTICCAGVRHTVNIKSDYSSTVQLISRLRVSAVAVGHKFHKERTFLVIDRPFAGILDGLKGCNDIHSVNLPHAFTTQVSRRNSITHLNTRYFIASGVIRRV